MLQSITEAIILAGGLGTRLRSTVPDLPKCMAPVNGIPFIAYVIHYLQEQGIKKFVFALGYKSETFDLFLRNTLPSAHYCLSVENEPLGTGGAIQLACRKVMNENIVVANGDTLFRVNIPALSAFHHKQKAECTIALKPMKVFSRYGVITLNKDHSVENFKEKQYYDGGLINGGIYALNVPAFLDKRFPDKFSFEQEYLERFYKDGRIFGITQDAYFIDIGIPEDYKRAAAELHPDEN